MAEVLERSVVARSDAAGVLERIGDPAVGLAIWRRPVPPGVQAVAPRLAEGVIDLRCVLTLERKATSALAGRLAEIGSGTEALAFDLTLLARVLAVATGQDRFALRLETVRDDGCSRFHVDNTGVRLVTTYHGEGTQWVPDPDVLDLQRRYRKPVQALDAGDVALFRGKKSAGGTVPHRSPPSTGDGARLVAVLDPAAW